MPKRHTASKRTGRKRTITTKRRTVRGRGRARQQPMVDWKDGLERADYATGAAYRGGLTGYNGAAYTNPLWTGFIQDYDLAPPAAPAAAAAAAAAPAKATGAAPAAAAPAVTKAAAQRAVRMAMQRALRF